MHAPGRRRILRRAILDFGIICHLALARNYIGPTPTHIKPRGQACVVQQANKEKKVPRIAPFAKNTKMVRVEVPLLVVALISRQAVASAPLLSVTARGKPIWGTGRKSFLWNGRGGEASATEEKEEVSLDDKVYAAMKKLGMDPPSSGETEECEGGACPLPSTQDEVVSEVTETESVPETVPKPEEKVNVHEVAKQIAEDMNVNQDLAMAALGATAELQGDGDRKFSEDAARNLIQQELDVIGQVPHDSEEVQQLVSEGFDPFLSRRALAFAEMSMDDARAILIADQQDEEEEATAKKQAEEDEEAKMRVQLRAEAEAQKAAKPKEELKTVTVDANFDPTAPLKNAAPAAGLGGLGKAAPAPSTKPPSPAKKSDVVFDATTAQVQELVMESPVPVLLDVYADWCGPCKALTPALEEMAVKAGGLFRLVKINSDNERPVSTALEVTALPTVLGIKDGKIVHMFQGMPRDENAMKNFMMGLLMPGASFEPPVTAEEQEKYNVLSAKLAKTAGSASFSFSARERLQDRTLKQLDELVKSLGGDMAAAEDSAKTLRSLMSNVIRNPFDAKFRKVNLKNKVIAARVAAYPSCISVLKSIGFAADGAGGLMMGKGKKSINVAPLVVARDCIDKWIDKNRHMIAAANRKRIDEIARARLAEEAENASDEEDEEEDEEDEVDQNACNLKLRLDGKNKVHEVVMNADDPLSAVLDALPVSLEDGQEVQLICAAKRLVVKSTDEAAMEKSLREHRLMPAAAIVVKVSRGEGQEQAGSKLAERASAKKKQKKGSHTMQSIGIYSKDDDNKANLIDGGGGVWYEHDVSDDENEDEAEADDENESNEDESEDGEADEGDDEENDE